MQALRNGFGLLRWRWWRDATAEVARRLRFTTVAFDDAQAIGALREQMQQIERVARWVPRSRCLDRALQLLDRADQMHIPARLRIGVLRDAHGVKAHAWVIIGDVVIDPDPASTLRYLPMQQSTIPLEFD